MSSGKNNLASPRGILKKFLRKHLGDTYPILMRLKSNKYIYALKKYCSYIFFIIEVRGRKKFTIDIKSPMGMGAILSYFVRIKAYAEAKGYEIGVISSCPLYSAQGRENLLSEYFLNQEGNNLDLKLSGRASEWIMQEVLYYNPDLDQARRIFKSDLVPNEAISSAVSEFIDLNGEFDVAVHFRGTDKFIESGSVSYESLFECLEIIEKNKRLDTIFLATDDVGFRKCLESRFHRTKFITYDICEVEVDIPRHFSNADPSALAMEALVNIFLISKAEFVIRTSSYLSGMAFIASAGQISKTVNWTNTKYFPFPESTIHQRECFEMENSTALDACAGE